MTKYLDL